METFVPDSKPWKNMVMIKLQTTQVGYDKRSSADKPSESERHTSTM